MPLKFVSALIEVKPGSDTLDMKFQSTSLSTVENVTLTIEDAEALVKYLCESIVEAKRERLKLIEVLIEYTRAEIFQKNQYLNKQINRLEYLQTELDTLNEVKI